MSNATHSDTASQHTNERQVPCPSWCASHQLLDEGTPDACLIHAAEPRHVEGVCIELRATEFMDGYREQPFLYVDGTEMSMDGVARFAAALVKAMGIVFAEGRVR